MIRGIKGVKDLLPDETPRWQFIEGKARGLATRYGFREVRIPIFEVTELFARSIGATTDIVEKEMYTFQDRDGTSLTLRPEGTAGTVRAYVEHNLAASPTSNKLFYLGPMFRHERPQAGRLRQFHQLGVEFLGNAEPGTDVEVISLLWEFFRALRLHDLTLELNTLGEGNDRMVYRGVLAAFLEERESALCANCRRRIKTNPLRVLDCKVASCREATEDAPKLVDHLSPRARAHFEEVQSGLTGLNIPHVLNPRLVRGLDYYTLTAFEITSPHLGAQNAIGAGGRYDGLVEALGGPPTPAVGFAVGLERVAVLIPEDAIPAPLQTVFVAAFGKDGAAAGLRLLHALRCSGIAAETHYGSAALKSLLRHADRRGAAFAAILGDDEVARGALVLRDMTTKEQKSLPLHMAVEAISRELEAAEKRVRLPHISG